MTKQLGALPVSGVNNFAEEGQSKIHHFVVSKEKSSNIAKEKVASSEKVTSSEEVEKGNNFFNDMEYPVVTICRKGLDNFQGYYIASTDWFNLNREWLKMNVSTLEPDLYKNFLTIIFKVKILKHINLCSTVR